jgi:hypothetical protein
MLNHNPICSPLDLKWLRHSREGTLFFTRGNRCDCLTHWPHLASFRRYSRQGAEWEPNAKAGNRVLAGFSVPDLHYSLRSGLLCDNEDGQALMPSLLEVGDHWQNRAEREQHACVRLDAQWQSDFEKSVPPEYLIIAARFRRNAIAVLRLLTICSDAQVLARENPAAFFEMACHFDRFMSDYTLRSDMLHLLRNPPRAIFTLRGLPATETACRLFGRMPAGDVSSPRLQALGRALAHPGIGRWLPQLKTINAHVADLLGDLNVWPYLTPDYVAELSQTAPGRTHFSGDPGVHHELSTHVHMALKRLRWFHRQVTKSAAPFRTFKSAAELDSLPTLPNRLRDFEAPPRPERFPLPPVAGTTEIIPITSYEELIEEGSLLQNCAGDPTHVHWVLMGLSYFYRVTAPERCTVEIQQVSVDGGAQRWIIAEMRTWRDALPRRTTLRATTDALGLPAAPHWHPEDCWWSDDRRYVCVPKPRLNKPLIGSGNPA